MIGRIGINSPKELLFVFGDGPSEFVCLFTLFQSDSVGQVSVYAGSDHLKLNHQATLIFNWKLWTYHAEKLYFVMSPKLEWGCLGMWVRSNVCEYISSCYRVVPFFKLFACVSCMTCKSYSQWPWAWLTIVTLHCDVGLSENLRHDCCFCGPRVMHDDIKSSCQS